MSNAAKIVAPMVASKLKRRALKCIRVLDDQVPLVHQVVENPLLDLPVLTAKQVNTLWGACLVIGEIKKWQRMKKK